MTINMTLSANILKGDFERIKARLTYTYLDREEFQSLTKQLKKVFKIISTKGLRSQLKIMVTKSSNGPMMS